MREACGWQADDLDAARKKDLARFLPMPFVSFRGAGSTGPHEHTGQDAGCRCARGFQRPVAGTCFPYGRPSRQQLQP